MKWAFFLCGLLAVGSTHATEPSNALIYSCMSAIGLSQSIHATRIATTESMDDDTYKPGYNATFFRYNEKDIGYAQSTKSNALIYDGVLYQTGAAIRLLARKDAPVGINPNLATWLVLREGKDRFLCVSDNLDGLGRSGSNQNVRYAYLLSLSAPRRLYFALDDIRHYKK